MGISVRYENAVAVVSICRPEALNALNRDLIDQLDACISEIESRRAVKSVILPRQQELCRRRGYCPDG